MEDFEKIIEYVRPWYVSNLNVRRKCDQGIATVCIEITDDIKSDSITLVGLNDFDAIASILDAERLIISRELGCQREFGSIRVECFDDGGYIEYWCDSCIREANVSLG